MYCEDVCILIIYLCSVLLVTSQHIYHVLCGAIEGGISDSDGDRNRDKEDEGELVSDNENEEDEGRGGGGEMEHSGLTVSIVSNLSSILLQLSGPDAISAINLIIGCVILCKISNDCDEEEDGEINTSAIAKRQLLEGVQQLMVRFFMYVCIYLCMYVSI